MRTALIALLAVVDLYSIAPLAMVLIALVGILRMFAPPPAKDAGDTESENDDYQSQETESQSDDGYQQYESDSSAADHENPEES